MSREHTSLPENWQPIFLKEIGTLHCGQSPATSKVNNEGKGTPYVTGPEQWDGTKLILNKWTTDPRRIVPEGCIFITVKGAGVGKLFRGTACAIGRDVFAFEPSNELPISFIEHAIHSSIAEVKRRAKGDIPGLKKNHILDHQLGLAPLPEQHRIVSAIESLQARSSCAREALNEVGPLLDQFRQSVLQAAFSGRLTADWRTAHPDVEPASELLERIRTERRERWEQAELAKYEAKGKKPPKHWKEKYKEPEPLPESEVAAQSSLPDGWCWTTFGETFDVQVGSTPSRGEPSYWKGPISWVSSGEVAFCRINATKETITESGLANTSTKLHPPGTVLLGMIGEGKTRGQAAILEIEACNNQNSAAIRVADTDIPAKYVYYHLRLVYEQTRRVGSGNNQQALNKRRVQSMIFPLAPVAEQRVICQRICELLDNVVETRASVEESKSTLTQLDQSILAKAFHGELVPQDPNDEPASELLARIRAAREQAKATTNKKSKKKWKAASSK